LVKPKTKNGFSRAEKSQMALENLQKKWELVETNTNTSKLNAQTQTLQSRTVYEHPQAIC
jgi:hypothetical protein